MSDFENTGFSICGICISGTSIFGISSVESSKLYVLFFEEVFELVTVELVLFADFVILMTDIKVIRNANETAAIIAIFIFFPESSLFFGVFSGFGILGAGLSTGQPQ